MRPFMEPGYWAFEVDNLTGTPPTGSGTANCPGTGFTAGANDADGAVATVLSALAQDVHFIEILIGGISLSAADSNAMLDVLIDAGGGTPGTEIISDLVCGFTYIPTRPNNGLTCLYRFPLYIKAGASVGVRCKTHHTSAITDGRVVIWAYGASNLGLRSHWCGARVETLGAGANSSGVAITPGNSGAFGSWTNVGGATTGRYGWLELGVNGTDSVATGGGYGFKVGAASTQLGGTPIAYYATDTTEVSVRGAAWWNGQPVDIASGTQLQVQASQSSAGADIPNVCLYGVL